LVASGWFSSYQLARAAGFNPWPKLTTPSAGESLAIGGYSAGCLAGARALEHDGTGYQVMHPSRGRSFGHPDLLDFIRTLGAGVHGQALDDLLIGDLSQARGGRATGGHSSHQSGLDVDIWYWAPASVRKGPLPNAQREKLKARSVIDGRTGKIRVALRKRVKTVLELASKDERVERIFVHPIIKRDLCADAGERVYLRKLRPWHGHDDHLHARLACPKDSPDCTPQEPFAQGDGCDELDWWFDDKAQQDRKEAQKKYQTAVVEGKGWPKECNVLLK
jgi:penicillin-insensitive murein endopeptidase